MQADVILKEPPPWMPPLSLSGGARVEGGGGARPLPRTPLIGSLSKPIDLNVSRYKVLMGLKHFFAVFVNIIRSF